jgi:hypothetical protein
VPVHPSESIESANQKNEIFSVSSKQPPRVSRKPPQPLKPAPLEHSRRALLNTGYEVERPTHTDRKGNPPAAKMQVDEFLLLRRTESDKQQIRLRKPQAPQDLAVVHLNQSGHRRSIRSTYLKAGIVPPQNVCNLLGNSLGAA